MASHATVKNDDRNGGSVAGHAELVKMVDGCSRMMGRSLCQLTPIKLSNFPKTLFVAHLCDVASGEVANFF